MNELEELDKKYLWHPYTQMSELLDSKIRVIVKGEGFYLIDNEGNKYIDGVASMWCNVWGHGKKELIDAIKKQLDILQHSSLFGISNDKSIILAEKLCKLTGMDKVFYSNDGSSAMEVAIKLAIQYWQNINEPRNRILALKNGYHGDTVGCMSLGYLEHFFRSYRQLLFNVRYMDSPNGFRKNKGMTYDDYINYCIDSIEKELKNNDVACLVMESGAQIAGGIIIYPKGYQSKLDKLCKKYGTLLILDEIATGLGRLGNMVEFIAQDSRPDIVTYGKMLTGGYMPLSVTLTTKKIYDAFLGYYYENKQLFHGHTYTGYTLGCAAALANLELYDKYNLISTIRNNSKIIENRLKEFNMDIIEDIRYKGMVAGIELKYSKQQKLPRSLTQIVMEESLKKGAYIRPLSNVVTIIPPLAIDSETLNKLMDITYEVVLSLEKIIK